MALCFAKKKPKSLILHSDRGVQFTSKKFVEFCEQEKIIQSMSAAGCPYDNAPMERYFNTLKTELINTNQYFSTEHLQTDISKFAHFYGITIIGLIAIMAIRRLLKRGLK